MTVFSLLKQKSLMAAFAASLAFAGPAVGADVLTHHGKPDRSGNFVVPGLTLERAAKLHVDPNFHAAFSGHVYAQPLYWRGTLIIATENNTVEALDAKTGRNVWHRALGAPVSLGALSCGNIDPLGITGTPAIDQATETLYLDALVTAEGGPRHEVFALSLKDGSNVAGWPIDVAAALMTKGQNFVARDQNERGALAILGALPEGHPA
jgi:outer membrane protein assembly factor BamB